MKKVLGLITILMFFINHSYAYENTFEYPDKILPLINDTCIIKTVVEYKSYEEEKIMTKEIDAVTFYLGGGYFVALTHATEQKAVIEHALSFGSYIEFIEVLNYSFIIDGYTTDLVGREDDISLFKALNYPKQTTVFKFGDSDKLKLGDKVIMIGNSFMWGVNIKEGIISQFDVSEEIEDKYDFKQSYLITNPTNTGDSGSALIAKQDGEYYVIGIVHATAGEGMGFVFNSNYVVDTINRILQKSLNDVIFIKHEIESIIEKGLSNP